MTAVEEQPTVSKAESKGDVDTNTAATSAESTLIGNEISSQESVTATHVPQNTAQLEHEQHPSKELKKDEPQVPCKPADDSKENLDLQKPNLLPVPVSDTTATKKAEVAEKGDDLPFPPPSDNSESNIVNASTLASTSPVKDTESVGDDSSSKNQDEHLQPVANETQVSLVLSIACCTCMMHVLM